MEQTAFELQFSYETEEEFPFLSAIVAAGGSSRRMGYNKLMASLCGVPVLARTLLALEHSRAVGEIIVVGQTEDLADCSRFLDTYGLKKVTAVVEGGANRVLSVANGLEKCRPDTQLICVQDGARPLTSPPLIDRVAKACVIYGAVAAAVPVKDTVKVVNEDGMVLSTPNRDTLWTVQTPQIFQADLYRKAMAQALEQGLYPTDDCGLVEAYGEKVHLVQGDYANLKITTPVDLAVAAVLLEQGEE